MYFFAAAALGVLWYAALLVPFATRQILHYPSALVWLCVTSLIVALAFRRAIMAADTVRSAALAVVLPLIGATIYAWLASLRSPSIIPMLLFGPLMAVRVAVEDAFYVVFPMGFISQSVLASIGRRSVNDRDRRFWRVTAFVLVVAAAAGLWLKQTDGVHQVTADMSWQVFSDERARNGQPLVVLTFVKHHEQSVGIYSQDLSNYLSQHGSPVVPVTFEITYRGRTFVGYHEIRIADLTNWRSPEGGYGSADESAFTE